MAKQNHRENNTRSTTTRRDVVRHTVRRRAKANCRTAAVSAVCVVQPNWETKVWGSRAGRNKSMRGRGIWKSEKRKNFNVLYIYMYIVFTRFNFGLSFSLFFYSWILFHAIFSSTPIFFYTYWLQIGFDGCTRNHSKSPRHKLTHTLTLTPKFNYNERRHL